ncbi:MAG: DUF4314 domain-containing protein [Ruminococcus sp.]|nr:DUF4314 domain-containing protein [Ruminococcus sp.]
MQFPNKDQIEKIRQEYPVGIKVRLIKMDDKQAPPVGTVGVVEFVDDIGSVHTHWENGSGLAFIPEIDMVQKL